MGKIIDLPLTFDPEDIIARKGIGFDPDFQIFTSGIEADRQNPRLVHMIGSSTEKDLQGDTMSLLALNDMTKSPPNMSIWLNHDYNLPDSIFGSVLGTPAIFHQDGVADLRLSVDVEMDNPAAARVKRYIDNGRRLGCSIGCMVTKYEVPTEEDGDNWFEQSIIIHGVYVVEYSVVGIPCNQRSWVENAVRGVFQRNYDPALAPAMKALWPSAYKKAVKSLPQERREVLDQIPARTRPEARLEWMADSKVFSFSRGSVIKEFQPEEVRALFRDGGIATEDSGVQGDVQPESSLDAQPEEVKEITDVQTEDIDEADAVKGVCGSTSWPLNMDASWDKGSAHKNLLEWAGGKENFSPAKFKKVHFRYEGEGTQISDFHFPFCNVSGGKVEAIWHAVTASAEALGGARGGAHVGGDEAGMRKKIGAYYHKAGKTPPWEGSDDSKSIEDAGLVEKGVPDLVGDAASAPESQDPAPAVTPVEMPEIPAHQLVLLSSYNALAKSLSLPEIAPEHLVEAQRSAVLKTATILSPDLQRLQAMHDMIAVMSGGQVCGSYMDSNDGDADDDAHATVSNGPLSVSYNLGNNVMLLNKAIEQYHQATLDLFDVKKDAAQAKQDLTAAREQISTLALEIERAHATIAALKDMPLGNPVAHVRTVHAEDSTVTHGELLQVQQGAKRADVVATDSLKAALALTEIKAFGLADGSHMRYRVWPDGVGGSVAKGVRPDLTNDQISMMSFTDIVAYREGRAAKVPYIANSEARVTNA